MSDPKQTLREREAALRAEIQSAQEKARRIHEAIEMRRKTLNRLHTQIVLDDDRGAARHDHG